MENALKKELKGFQSHMPRRVVIQNYQKTITDGTNKDSLIVRLNEENSQQKICSKNDYL